MTAYVICACSVPATIMPHAPLTLAVYSYHSPECSLFTLITRLSTLHLPLRRNFQEQGIHNSIVQRTGLEQDSDLGFEPVEDTIDVSLYLKS